MKPGISYKGLHKQMNINRFSRLLSKAMIVGEHPSEPMVIHASAKLKSSFPFHKMNDDYLISTTKNFLEQYPELVGGFDITNSAIARNSIVDFEQAAKQIWSKNNLNFQRFLEQKIVIDSLCLFRFRLTEEDGIQLAVHHALLDGRGMLHLLVNFLNFLIFENVSHENNKIIDKKIRFTPWRSTQSFFYFLFNKFKEFIYPPLILTEKEIFASEGAAFHTSTHSYEKIKYLYKLIKKNIENISLNDIILAAVNSVLIKRFPLKRNERLAILMPIDLRRHRGGNLYDNLSTGVNINCYDRDFVNYDQLLRKISIQTNDNLKFKQDLHSLNYLGLIDSFGILEESRQCLTTKNLPRRCFKGSKNFWRFASTAIFANLGTVRIEKALKHFIEDVKGYPAIISPTSLAITSFVYDDLKLNFHCSTNLYDEKELEKLSREIDDEFQNMINFFEGNER